MNETLIAYYINLLILQYRTKTKAPLHISNVVRNSMIYDLIRAVENGYDIDTAIGVQLDIIAKYVNAGRVINQFDFSRTFWSLVDYNEFEPYVDVAGVIDYNQEPIPDAIMLAYETDQKPAYTLTDDELRQIIKLKIVQNNSNHSPKEIDDLIFSFFGENVIFNDNLNMTIEYIFDEQLRRIIEIAEAENAIPKPMAVGLLLTFTPDIGNIYGMMDYGNNGIPGYLQGSIDYSDDPFGGWLNY